MTKSRAAEAGRPGHAVGVGRDLESLGRELAEKAAAQMGEVFTDIPEGDLLVKEDPNAFLLGVLFTQGIPAERAWAGPYLLSRRLGHLDLRRLAAEPEAVSEAVASRPALHRFKRTLPKWISAAAEKLLEEYGGDARAVWAEGSSAREVMEKLSAFPGIGRKKAAMAVELLVRHFGVALAGMEDANVAYDVHVRRVFLRSGLVRRDTPEEVERAARDICPSAPGTIDLPAWLIGRDHCRPKAPRCDDCPIGESCPKLTHLAVDGVGVRGPGGRRRQTA